MVKAGVLRPEMRWTRDGSIYTMKPRVTASLCEMRTRIRVIDMPVGEI